MYDIFISYRREGGIEFSRLLYEHLSRMGLKVFFDIEELNNGMFNKKLYESIEQCSNFILILSKNSLDRCVENNDWVKEEILHAVKNKKNIVPVMLQGFEWPEHLPDEINELRHYNCVLFSEYYYDASVEKLIKMLSNVHLKTPASVNEGNQINYEEKIKERYENKYFNIDRDTKELNRLNNQQRIMKKFDRDIYAKIESKYEKLVILDVGSNVGDLVIDRFGKSDKLSRLVGLEYDLNSVKKANEKYAVDDKISFYQMDVESDDLINGLEDIMNKCGIDNFNVIHISMLLLHLKNPYKLLKALRRFLSEDGSILIRDIDDGLNLAYPDENNDFKRVMDICRKDELSGFRESGRQIYTLLKRAGYKQVTLEKAGLNSAEMNFEERDALFDTYFSFVLEDLKIMAERHPDNEHLRTDLKWYSDVYEDMEQRFQDPNFFFSIGVMLYSAKKM